MSELMPVNDALNLMLSGIHPVSTTMVSLERCCGRVLCKDIISDVDLPPFSNSAMDGFAVASSDLQQVSADHPIILRIIADLPAGSSIENIHIKTGEAVRIMTGAPVPDGADAVVPVEDTDHFQNPDVDKNRVAIFRAARKGDSIRFSGEDIQKGENILSKGRQLKPQDVGMLASLGYTDIPVYRSPRVALLTSGDELVAPGTPLTPGKIYDSNSYTLSDLMKKYHVDLVTLGVVSDDEDQIKNKLDKAVDESVDLIVTSAGVSVGVYDYVRHVIEKNGELNLWRVNMRPGKPVAFGLYHTTPLIGLPGNPVSSYIGFLVFVLPVIERLAGLPETRRQLVKVRIAEDVYSDGRESYLRAKLTEKNGEISADLTGHQGSGNLFSLVKADALVIVPAGVTFLPAGSLVNAWFLA